MQLGKEKLVYGETANEKPVFWGAGGSVLMTPSHVPGHIAQDGEPHHSEKNQQG